LNTRQVRLGETLEAIAGPLDRLGRSLREDGDAILKADEDKSGHDLLATDAFLQRFQQLTDLTLRKLFPRLLGALEGSDMRHPLGAMLDRLDGYEILADVPWWLALNDLRNRLIHEDAMSVDERAEEMARAWQSALRLRDELIRIKEDRDVVGRLFRHD